MRTPPLILIVLAANHYEIITAADGEEGLAMARDAQPDLILLDIMMPKMDGIEVCRHIRADASLPFIPIRIPDQAGGSCRPGRPS
jgi:CheY-like chemotaxis protein